MQPTRFMRLTLATELGLGLTIATTVQGQGTSNQYVNTLRSNDTQLPAATPATSAHDRAAGMIESGVQHAVHIDAQPPATGAPAAGSDIRQVSGFLDLIRDGAPRSVNAPIPSAINRLVDDRGTNRANYLLQRDLATIDTPSATENLKAAAIPASSPETGDTPAPADSGDVIKEGRRDLGKLAKELGYNTLLVLAFGVSFIFVAKVWLKPSRPQSKGNQESADFEVISELKVGPKSQLMLVEISDQRLVVATDPTGVKSLVPLNESFASKMSAIEEEIAQQPATESAPEPRRPEVQLPRPARAEYSPEGVEPKDMTYSLGSIGKVSKKRRAAKKKLPSKTVESEIERALAEAGLKDLIMKTLRSGT